MERIFIIKDFLGLVGLTKSERIRLIKELIAEWHLNELDVTAPSAPAPDNETELMDNTPNAPGNNESDSHEEQLQETAPTVAATPVSKKQGRRKKAEKETTSSKSSAPTAAPPVPKRRGRQKKSEAETISPEIVSESSEVPTETPKKRRGRPKKVLADDKVSKSGIKEQEECKAETISPEIVSESSEVPTETPKKRRGRPKKVLADDKVAKSSITEQEELESLPISLSKEDVALIEEISETNNLLDLLDDEQPVPSKETRRRNQAFCYHADFPSLKPLTIGQEYNFEFLYQWKEKNLLSPYVLNGLMPVGIYIPYRNIVFGKYRGFIVYIYDEHVYNDAREAEETAHAMPSIDDEFWTIMDSLQWSVLKTYIEAVNRMLSKVGGDSLKKQYKTCSPRSSQICGIGGFRYAINVK